MMHGWNPEDDYDKLLGIIAVANSSRPLLLRVIWCCDIDSCLDGNSQVSCDRMEEVDFMGLGAPYDIINKHLKFGFVEVPTSQVKVEGYES